MTSQTAPRYGFSFSLMVAAMVMVAITTSFWTKGTGLAMVSDGDRIDVTALMTNVDTTTLPVLHIESPF